MVFFYIAKYFICKNDVSYCLLYETFKIAKNDYNTQLYYHSVNVMSSDLIYSGYPCNILFYNKLHPITICIQRIIIMIYVQGIKPSYILSLQGSTSSYPQRTLMSFMRSCQQSQPRWWTPNQTPSKRGWTQESDRRSAS